MTRSYIADLHIHSRYSRATSKASHLHGLAAWAAIKGIQVVGTGDFTHPAWFSHLTEVLEEAEPGFFRIRKDSSGADLVPVPLPPGLRPDIHQVRFVLTAEISSIYKRDGRVRKIHNVLFAPDFESVRRINTVLAGIGNLEADGRPILGLDARHLLEILLEQAEQGFLVPAHIWTPWFSLFGSKSGFDSLEECFGDLSDHVFALETGLSSDPDMNRCVSALDRLTLISNSDCHSPAKLGREANIFATGFDYFSMQEAIRSPRDPQGRQVFTATIEFYPEEGKYHLDGHRRCGVCLQPAQTLENRGRCPVCKRPLTVGVLYRVMQLADRSSPVYPAGSPAVHSLIPLPEILGELLGTGPATKKVLSVYSRLITIFGSEFDLLLHAPLEDISRQASPLLAEAIDRARKGTVIRKGGFDGEFGVIRVFSDEERSRWLGQLSLFGTRSARPRKRRRQVDSDLLTTSKITADKGAGRPVTLNPEQQAVVDCPEQAIIVKAGPGTGKTQALVKRVERLVRETGARCTVITFTNKAADGVRRRLEAVLGRDMTVFTATFHGYCLEWLRRWQPDLRVAGPETRRWILARLFPGESTGWLVELGRAISRFFLQPGAVPSAEISRYLDELEANNLVDMDQVVPRTVRLLQEEDRRAEEMCQETANLFVDEFQDLNRPQYELVLLLAARVSVFAIGDPDQAIYGFRGSDPVWFGRFVETVHPARFSLYRNYRSGARILEAAARVIACNPHQETEPALMSMVEAPGVLYSTSSRDDAGEGRFVAAQIQRLVGGTSHREIERLSGTASEGVALSDIGVLYRTGRQAEAVARALAEQGVPFQVVDIVPFYLQQPVRPFYDLLLLAAGLADTTQVLALLAGRPGIGRERLKRLELEIPLSCPSCLDYLLGHRPADSRLARAVENLAAVRDQVRKLAEEQTPADAVQAVTGYCGVDDEDPNLSRLLTMLAQFTDLEQAASHLRRYADTVVYDERAEAVTLMTLHAAKGLEFRVVFIVGLEEGLLPLDTGRQEMDAAHVQEERRLFFVGMTRAREILYLCRAERRQVYGETRTVPPSRFLAEIGGDLLREPPAARRKPGGGKGRPGYRQLSLF